MINSYRSPEMLAADHDVPGLKCRSRERKDRLGRFTARLDEGSLSGCRLAPADLSVLIMANVISRALGAGYRRIGVLKSIGFTSAQVVAAYMVQAGVPALADSACGARPGRSAVAAAAMLFGVTAVAPRWIMPHLAARVVPLLEERGSQTHTACEPWPLRARDR